MRARRRSWFGEAALVSTVLLATGWTALAGAQQDDPVLTAEEWELALKAQEQLEENPPRTEQKGLLSVGPDVTIIDLSGVGNYTSGGGTPCPPGYEGNCRGYSIGTNSCNIGTVPVDWCDQPFDCRTTTDAYHLVAPATVTDHSVIAQNVYRLKDGRFEQIGQSFLKHGFLSTNSPDAGCMWNDNGTPNSSCVGPPAGGDQLGLGCTDFYGSSLNGGRPLGRRSQVNAADADHPENPAGGEVDDDYDQRIVVQETDLDPSLNPDALYWVEGQYVVRDDARSGRSAVPGNVHPWLGENGLNNASYRQVVVGDLPALNLTMTGPTVRETAAIFAWQAADPGVDIVEVDRQTLFPGDPIDPPAAPGFYLDHRVLERFHAARRVTATGNPGTPYHYEYAIHNLNSDTGSDGFLVEFPAAATFANIGFHDVDHHSGEPYDTSDWTVTVDGPNGTVSWAAVPAGANTNALRWGTAFSFWFDASRPPDDISEWLDLFKIQETRFIRFPELSFQIFSDGFETGDTSAWSLTEN